jgi:hypothetical protein
MLIAAWKVKVVGKYLLMNPDVAVRDVQQLCA